MAMLRFSFTCGCPTKSPSRAGRSRVSCSRSSPCASADTSRISESSRSGSYPSELSLLVVIMRTSYPKWHDRRTERTKTHVLYSANPITIDQSYDH